MTDPVLHPDPDDEFYFQEGCHILEMLNRPDDPDLSIARARVAPGVRTRLHHLTGTRERYVVMKGEGLVLVGNDPAIRVGPGDVVSIPSDTVQSIFNNGDQDLVFLAICTPRFRIENYRDDGDPPQQGTPDPCFA